MSNETSSWAIAITFCDEKNNGFVTLGGAAWLDKEEWDRQWSDIPVSPLGEEDPAMLVADKMNDEHDLVDQKPVTADTVERLMGRSIDELIAEGRERTVFTLGEALQKDPGLADEFMKLRKARH